LSQPLESRIPPSSEGIQVNFCHNPNCGNFGIPASNERSDPRYRKVAVGKLQPAIKCKLCGDISQLKSNKAIVEEVNRISRSPLISRAVRHTGYSCPTPDCQNYLLKISTNPKQYRKRGSTSSGNQKFSCKQCGKMFTVGSKKHREGVKNFANSHIGVFKHLVIGTPLRGIEQFYETTNTETYRKIDLFYERCMLFAHERERRIATLSIPRMQLACDRQDYLANWSNRKDKRTTQLSAIGTADKESGYVFGMEINFDSSISLQTIIEDPSFEEGLKQQLPFRTHARVWTPDEIKLFATEGGREHDSKSGLSDLLESQRLINGDRSIVEMLRENKLPSNGVQVHSEYTQYAHFIKLADQLRNVGRLTIYTDLEAGIANAINLAFKDRIVDGNVKHLFLHFNKGLTNDERRNSVGETKRLIEEFMNQRGWSDPELAELALISFSMLAPIEADKRGMVGSSNIWFHNPINTINECEKRVSFVKSARNLDWEHRARLIRNATLAPIDTFFNQVREKVSYLGRGSANPSSNRRIWNKQSPYNPAQMEKVLQIYRVYRNFCMFRSGSKETPAMRLGLAKGKVSIMDIIG